jgi:hypothetical protein
MLLILTKIRQKLKNKMKKPQNKKYLIIFGLCVVLLLLGIWFWNRNSYSKEALKLEILAPESVAAGQDIEYIVKFKNNGDIRLDNPVLSFEFPQYSIPGDGGALRRNIEGEEIGTAIYPGAEKTFRFKGKLFGQVGDAKEATAIITYQPKNLTAKYVSKTTHLASINNVPITFDFDIPSEIESLKPLDFSLNYFSSLSFSLSDITIKTTYPSGFIFTQSTPKGLSQNEWRLKSLNSAQGGRIKLNGSLGGEVGDAKTFVAEFGIWVNGEYVILKKVTKDVTLVEPSIYLDQMINGVQEYVATQGDALHYQVIFRNIGDRAMQDLFLTIKLKSDLLDFTTLKAPDGQFTAGDNTIMWDSRKISALKYLDAGEEGQVEFWINLSPDKISASDAPQIENEVRLGQTKKTFSTKINSKFDLVQELATDDDLFGSTGPLPLTSNQESVLTVFWRLKNYYSNLKDIKIKASVPSYISLTGQMNPQELVFDSQTRELLWNIPELLQGAGITIPKVAGFQIKLKPTSNQKGSPVVILNNISITAQDQATGNTINLTFQNLDTSYLGVNGIVK